MAPQETCKALTMSVVANAAPELRRAAQRCDRNRRGRSQAPAAFAECESWDLFGSTRDSLNLKYEIERH